MKRKKYFDGGDGKIMRKIMPGRKGGARYMSPYWFVILAMIALGMVICVMLFYNISVDARKIEAQLLLRKVAECMMANGQLTSQYYIVEAMEGAREDVWTSNLELVCKIKLEDSYVRIEKFDCNDKDCSGSYAEDRNGEITYVKNFPGFEMRAGVDYAEECGLYQESNFLQCSEANFYALDSRAGGGDSMLHIETAIGKISWGGKADE